MITTGNAEKLTHELSAASSFGAYCGALQVSSAASAQDLSEEIVARINMLQAMLCAVYGGGAESFNSLNDSIRDSYLWSCATMANDIGALSERLTTLLARRSTT